MSGHQKGKRSTKSQPSATNKHTRKSKTSKKLPSLPAKDSFGTGADQSIQSLKGVGPKKAQLLAKKGILSLRNAAEYFPFRYEDRRRLMTPRESHRLPENSLVTIRGRIVEPREIPLRGKKRRMVEAWLEEEKPGYGRQRVRLLWFNSYAGLLPRLQTAEIVVATGQLAFFRNQPQITHPELENVRLEAGATPQSLHWGRIVPIYSATYGLTQRSLREVIHAALLMALPDIEDEIPSYIREENELAPIAEALQEVHFPKGQNAEASEISEESLRRFIFEEFFKFQLLILIERRALREHHGESLRIRNNFARDIRKQLPFQLTEAQEKVIVEILEDLQSEKPMHRLVQGDVGCGKTMVAIMVAVEAIENGWQCALMAPTETLAEQHFHNAKNFFESLDLRIELLTGSLRKKEKDRILAGMADGSVDMVVGTHAVIQEGVAWKRLRLAIVDEQHRFGVKQRMALRNRKGDPTTAHLLTMTATPIPRSLALTAFGELDVSTIDQLPANRKAIATKVLGGEDRRKLYNLIHREVKRGRQCYMVYPLIQQSEAEGMEHLRGVEEEFKRLQAEALKGLRLVMLHGKTPTEERQKLMREFKEGKYDVLISTTVIEVGIDVPNATVIAIEHAERFGLSQLHQLRGRVGRGEHESYCVLVTDIPAPMEANGQGIVPFSDTTEDPNTTWKRLRVMENSQDGFVISEEDLKLRGPGDFLGTKQSGSPSFRIADLKRDEAILLRAREAAAEVLQNDPELEEEKHRILRRFCDRIFNELGETVHSG